MDIVPDVSENIRAFRSMMEKTDRSTDIFLLPELWTGRTKTRKADESRAALESVRGVCRDRGVYAVAGTMPWLSGDGFVNRAWIVDDAGTPFAFYDKAHLSSSSGEEKVFAAGGKPLLFNLAGTVCAVLVGGEIMFPEYARCAGLAGGGAIFIPARWEQELQELWEPLIRSTAASSQVYAVACNASCRGDLTREASFGQSAVVSPRGNITGSLGEEAGILTARLDMGEVAKCRKRLPLERGRRPELYGMLLG
jgi:predicted amidohydrolase